MTFPQKPALPAFIRFWAWLGCVSFGGPAGQIAMMQVELVERLKWIESARFLHALNFCMLLPGPEAQQLATYIGWRIYGVWGGVISGGLFVLPGAVAMLALAWIAAAFGSVPLVEAAFDGVKPAVVAIIALAIWRVGRRAFKGPAPVVLATAAFLALAVAGLPFPLVIAVAATVGFAADRLGFGWFAAPIAEDVVPETVRPSRVRLLRLVAIFGLLWAGPVVAVVAALGWEPWADLSALFTKAAFVTFGGAYAVLPYVAEQAVETHGWLSAAEMVNGLALAESTPGPLILVLEYVGFFAGWHRPGVLSPAAAGAVGAVLTVYLTFLPSFLFIFAGAPYVERLIHNRAAASALAAVTAAVVGVMANLGVYLGRVVLFPAGSPDVFGLVVAVLALAALTGLRLGLPYLVLASAGLGVLRALAGIG